MLGLSKIITKLQLGILIIWLSFTVAAFSYFVNEKLSAFDSNKKLTNIDYRDFSQYLSDYLPHNNQGIKKTVLHFSTPGCNCQQYSDKHILDINKLARKHDFNIKNISLSQDKLIPATPSIALIDDSGKVIYFGPYGEGIACSQTSGYAQTMLNNYVKGFNANIIIKEAEGCYCEI